MEQSKRLQALQAELAERGLAAYLVPKSDEYMLEYAPPSSERLAWLSGFTGSAGMALVGPRSAALFVDGRYTDQARRQSPEPLWEHHHLTLDPPAAHLERTLTRGDRVGYDARVHTPASLGAIRAAVESAGATLTPVEENLVDRLWSDRPAEPAAPVEPYPEVFAGEPAAQKRTRMAAELAREKLDASLVSAPECLMWLLNIRGADVESCPFALGRALLFADGRLQVYMASVKLGSEVKQAIVAQGAGAVSVHEPTELVPALAQLSGKRVRVDRGSASEWLVKELEARNARVDVGLDPILLAKACKNAAELAAIRAAHVRDGAAVVRFLAWFNDNAPGGHDEWSVAEKLAAFRAGGDNYRGPSFHTISAFGPSAALPHYRASKEAPLPLGMDNLYLVDSGGQYLDGTTDITRVTVIGSATPEMRRRYTQVLQGHIALATAHFPAGTTGSQLDPFARQFLWRDGVDFDHGTGHGVGCYLSVHEGPQNISKRPSDVALRPGMVVSNEPGYYKPGAYGIRIENLVAVVELSPQPEGAERTTLGFETLTLVPYERRLIDVGRLSPEERSFVDDYHARVREVISPLVDAACARFLRAATEPLRG